MDPLKKLFSVCLTLLAGTLLFADSSSKLNIVEQDGSPSTFPYKLKVTNGSLTDNGDGTASLATGSGGGSGGASSQEVFVGPAQSSPTPSITGYTGDFGGSVIGGTTFQFILNPATTDFIHNQNSLQAGSTSYSDYLYVGSSQTIHGPQWVEGTINSALNNFVNQSGGGYWLGGYNSFLSGVHSSTGGSLQLRTFAGDMYDQDPNGAITMYSSVTVTGAGGIYDTYEMHSGSQTGSGLTNCGDSTHAQAWNNGQWNCQAITGTGGGGSGSPIAITTGVYNSTYSNPAVSSPMVVGVYDQRQFNIAASGTTGYIQLQSSITFSTVTVTSQLSVTGPGDGIGVFTIGNSTYGFIVSTSPIAPNHVLIGSSTNYTAIDGGLLLTTQTVTVTISSGTGFNGLSIPVWRSPTNTAVTVVKILAESLGAGTTVLYQLDERAFGSVNSAGSSLFSVAFSTANNTGVTTTSFADSSLATQASLVLTTPAAGASAGAPTAMTFTIYYNRNTQ